MPYDNLNRLTQAQDGVANAANTGLFSYWNANNNEGWTMDAPGLIRL